MIYRMLCFPRCPLCVETLVNLRIPVCSSQTPTEADNYASSIDTNTLHRYLPLGKIWPTVFDFQSDNGIATLGTGSLATVAPIAGESVTVVGDVTGDCTVETFVAGAPMGRISVFSSRFFFCLGSGAAMLLANSLAQRCGRHLPFSFSWT